MRQPPGRKAVVITGASSGIGHGAALAFAERGDDVVLVARGREPLEEVADECRRSGGRAVAIPTDVSDEAAVKRMVAQAVDVFGRIDVLVNAAAVWSYGRFEDTPSQAFERVVATTLFGQVHTARAVLPQFRRQGAGVLVNVASLYGKISTPYVSPYVTAKWGLLGFSDVLRQELLDTPGVEVCTLLPGAVDTPIYRHAANYIGRDIRPLPPVVSPQRVVDAIVRAVDRPRPHIVVGQTQRIGTWLYAATPTRMYDRLVGPVTRLGALRRTTVENHDGNVFAPDLESSGVEDGWRVHDRRRMRGLAALAAATAIGAGALSRRLDRDRAQASISFRPAVGAGKGRVTTLPLASVPSGARRR